MIHQVILDIECYKNYFLAMFYSPVTDKYLWTEQYEDKKLNCEMILKILDTCEIVTFNGINYDIPVLSEALRGKSTEEIRHISDLIITQDVKHWQIEKQFGKHVRCDHVDLFEVSFGKSSLKIYGGRLGCKKLQDLPIDPNAILTREQMITIREYCKNDVLTTAALLKKLTPQIDLRRIMSAEHNVDLRSKSDAQIAEAVIAGKIQQITGMKPRRPSKSYIPFLYSTPDFLMTIPESVKDALREPFTIKANGTIEMPQKLSDLTVQIGNSTYQLGMGGIHSMEKQVAHRADDDYILCDWDVTSYYPSIILKCELYPPQLGREFLTVYNDIVDARIEAKKTGEKVKADSLKLVINGSFGKFGSPYSVLYSPNLLVQVTVTGQLSLLMLITWLESQKISVISANTDGIVCRCHKDQVKTMQIVIRIWEKQTGFAMERTDYTALYSRDVNSYVAIKPSGEVKTKGCFGSAGITKNPSNEICNMALIEYLKSGKPTAETISECQDITKFLTVRAVKGGAVKDDMYLGKAVRWYYAKGEEGAIHYKTNGNKVARSDGARPLMDLPDTFPTDIDYEWYIKETNDLMEDVGL